MRILVASVTNREADVLAPHVASILAQALPKNTTIELAYVSDNLAPGALQILHDAGASVADALPREAPSGYSVSETTHEWGLSDFEWLAREKQRLLEHARDGRYDAIFFVDSDLVLGADTLASLIYAQKDVVSGVFWTRWQPGAPPLPQVWMTHPYEMHGRGVQADEFLRSLEERSLVRVGGLGACTLMRSRVFDKLEWFPLLGGLPSGGMWQGEDRSFCIKAERNHVELWADAWPDIYHQYRPSEVLRLGEWQERFPLLVETPEVGDLVSLVLEPLEERELHSHREHVRGRLGALPVLPEIESVLGSMKVGETRVVKVEFPMSWLVAEYRGRSRNVLVRLVGAKRKG